MDTHLALKPMGLCTGKVLNGKKTQESGFQRSLKRSLCLGVALHIPDCNAKLVIINTIVMRVATDCAFRR